MLPSTLETELTQVQQHFARTVSPGWQELYQAAYSTLGGRSGVTPDLIIGLIESGLQLDQIAEATADPAKLG